MHSLIQRHNSAQRRPILSSLAEAMLEEGVSYAEFAELARYDFVNAAEKVLADKRRISDSRISIITGIHRKDVKHLRAMDGPNINPERASSNRAIAVISAWTRETSYKQLGRKRPSFKTALVACYFSHCYP